MPMLFVYKCLLATCHSRSWGCMKLKGSFPILGSIGDAPIVSCECLQRARVDACQGLPMPLYARIQFMRYNVFLGPEGASLSIIGRATVCELILSSTPEIWKEAQILLPTRATQRGNESVKARKNPNLRQLNIKRHNSIVYKRIKIFL